MDVYKAYVEDKVRKLPENLNVQDLAIKFCNHEINRRKNAEKGLPLGPIQLPGIPMALLVSSGVPMSAVGNNKSYDNNFGMIPNLPRSTTISVAPQLQPPPQPMDGVMITPVAMPMAVPKPINTGARTNNPGMGVSANAGAATAGGSGAGKPRGRPAGSKNVNVGSGGNLNSSAAMKQMLMGNVDPNMLSNMTALMSLYSSNATVSVGFYYNNNN